MSEIADPIGPSEDQNGNAPETLGVLLSDVVAEQVLWLWESRIPLGKLIILEGDPGLGKSALLTDAAARISVGRAWPDGTPCAAGGVVICSSEDGAADTIRPRLDAAGGDPSKVLDLTMVPDGNIERFITIPKDLDAIRQGIKRVGAQLVIMDPIMQFLSGDHNAHKDQDVRQALAPLAKLAEETGTAIVVVRHLNKASGGNPLYRGGGSIGIIGAARSALLVAQHPDDEHRRVLAPLKSNLAKPAPSLAFTLAEAANGAVRVEYKGKTPYNAETLLAPAPDPEERSALEEAKEFLRDALDDGPRYNKVLKKEAREADISEATLRRAKEALGVRANKEGDGSWSWAFEGADREGKDTQDEPQDTEVSEDAHLEHLEPLPLDKPSSEAQREQGAQEVQGTQTPEDAHLADRVSRIAAVLTDWNTQPGQLFDSHRSHGFVDGYTPIVGAVAKHFGDTKNFTAWIEPTYSACDQIRAETSA